MNGQPRRFLSAVVAMFAAAALIPLGAGLAVQPDSPAVPAPAQNSAALGPLLGSKPAPPTTVIPREGCVTTECHPGVKAHTELHGPVRVNACDGCHRLTDADRHAFAPVKGRHDLCTLCHAPEAPAGTHLHEPYAKGECLACHDPHGGSGVQLLRGRRYADSCAACHKDVGGGHDSVHGPVSAGACGACHEPHASSRPKLLSAEGRDLCLKCHVRTGIQIESSPIVHAPALGDCRACHDPHATDHAALLTADTSKLCTECHHDVAHTMAAATTQHAAVTTKRGCTNCHSPHAGNHASLLRSEPKDLCFECHNQSIPLPDGSKLPDMKALVETGKSLHGAITQRGCIECHEIHGGGHRRLLTHEYPSEIYFPFSESSYALCFSCHDRQLVMEAQTTSATGFRNGDTNLHAVHVNRDKKGRSCRVCHDAHAASQDQHIRDSVVFGSAGWKLPIKFQSLPDGGKCAGTCHAPFEYNRVKPLTYPSRTTDGAWKGDEMIPGTRANPTPPTNAPK